jgi:diguanylate cyclase (GGDEF)-like protein
MARFAILTDGHFSLTADSIMPRLSSTHRIVLGLVSLTVTALLACGMLGLVPNTRQVETESRQAFCETTAISFMALAPRMDHETFCQTLEQLRLRRDDVESIGIRRAAGELVISNSDHSNLWTSTGASPNDNSEFIVPIQTADELWGQLEVRFEPQSGVVLFGYQVRPEIVMSAVMALFLFITFTLYLKRVLKHLSPGRVIPNRVRDALNALVEGLLVLDAKQNIVLANASFSRHIDIDPDELVGRHPERLGFRLSAGNQDREFPWTVTAQSSKPVNGTLLSMGEGDAERTFSVGTVPVCDEAGRNRGVVASFEDVTQLRRKQTELSSALTSLRASSEEIRIQNKELEWLATRDTLTGCVNRRSFFSTFETEWQKSQQKKQPMSGFMLDIDDFKSINDNHGLSTGDEVLRDVATAIMNTVDDTDIVCRYGGEEFAVLMPDTPIGDAELRAERCRLALKALTFRVANLKVTASLGISSLCQNPTSPQDLLDQADKCLYAAKGNRRNQVVRWDKAQPLIDQLAAEAAAGRAEERRETIDPGTAIPFHAVAALTTALAHRDQATAVHSRRVADFSVATAEGLLSMRDCYVLEIAALLHDIGKIGIPDSVLQKPGPLSPEEQKLVQRYNHLGVDMVRGSFGQEVLTEIVEQQVVHFDMSNAHRGTGSRRRPSVSCRILSIANAFDVMITGTGYRAAVSQDAAFRELRECGGTQFDPELVERFISTVKLRHAQVLTTAEVPLETALRLGLSLERIVTALDQQDMEQLRVCAEQVNATAAEFGISDMSFTGTELVRAIDEEQDMIDVMQLAGELLDQCRATQSRLIDANSSAVEEDVHVCV